MLRKSSEDFVTNIKENRPINSLFAVSDKVIKTAASGKKYINFTLSDNKGSIIGRIFPDGNANELYDSIGLGSICKVMGNVNEFPRGSGTYNIIIRRIIELSEEEKYDISDFMKVSPRNEEELISEIENTIEIIEADDLKKLLNSFFSDKKFTEEFYKSPSAKIYHHNYIGGLLEHTASVLSICKTVCEIFPELDKDLLYTGAILHDIGKLRAYDYSALSIEISNEGDLLDHLFISGDMIQEKVKELNLPTEVSTNLLHLVLSHHGEVKNGWGSPVNPKIPEAVALHHADNLDAKVKGMLQISIDK